VRTRLYFRLAVGGVLVMATGWLLAVAGLGIWGFYASGLVAAPCTIWALAATRPQPGRPSTSQVDDRRRALP
jgi:hypothetical protein